MRRRSEPPSAPFSTTRCPRTRDREPPEAGGPRGQPVSAAIDRAYIAAPAAPIEATVVVAATSGTAPKPPPPFSTSRVKPGTVLGTFPPSAIVFAFTAAVFKARLALSGAVPRSNRTGT